MPNVKLQCTDGGHASRPYNFGEFVGFGRGERWEFKQYSAAGSDVRIIDAHTYYDFSCPRCGSRASFRHDKLAPMLKRLLDAGVRKVSLDPLVRSYLASNGSGVSV